ncbi:MAG TPA: hypothetical protein VG147_11240 [Solirubrobacteraceae bacterium]|nr:hypothetical protein [Solirubrobacteraceae bacterium]
MGLPLRFSLCEHSKGPHSDTTDVCGAVLRGSQQRLPKLGAEPILKRMDYFVTHILVGIPERVEVASHFPGEFVVG